MKSYVGELHDPYFRQYYPGDHIKKNEMDGSCGMCGGEERCTQNFVSET